MKVCEEKMYTFYKVLADKNRFKIFCYILSKWKTCVCDIVNFTKLRKNLVSHHLKVLKEVWLVISEKKWLNVYYKINKKAIESFLNSLTNLSHENI